MTNNNFISDTGSHEHGNSTDPECVTSQFPISMALFLIQHAGITSFVVQFLCSSAYILNIALQTLSSIQCHQNIILSTKQKR